MTPYGPSDCAAGPIRAAEAKIDETYFQAMLKRPLHFVYEILEPHLSPPGLAVDLGCGVGTASLFLLEKGFDVVAVDENRRALEIVASRLLERARIELVEDDIANWEIPSCDVVSAGFSLFFLKPEELPAVWPKIVAALKPGGLFAGQFLGVNDEWADKGHALVDDATLRQMLTGFHLIHYEEVDREGETAVGNVKHWHVFHVVARKLA